MTILKYARKLDYDRTLAAITAKAPEALFALIAFNAELASIRAKVTEPVIFEMRLVWWREAIEGIEKGEVRKHPVIEALVEPLRFDRLDQGLLEVMIIERFREFSEPAKNFTAFVEERAHFLEAFYMNSYCALEVKEDGADFAAFRAFDLVRVWQGLPFLKRLGLLPFKGKPDPKPLKKLLAEGTKCQAPYFRALWALSNWHFKRLERAGFDPAKVKTASHHPGKFIALWRA